MTRLPALIQTFAEGDTRGYATIKKGARAIREELLVTTKRGCGASAMSDSDAATLFIGLNGTNTLAEGPAAAKWFGALQLPPSLKLGDNHPKGIRTLANTLTFHEAVANLIAMTPDLRMEFEFAIKFYLHAQTAQIATGWHPWQTTKIFEYNAPANGINKALQRASETDREVQITVQSAVIERLHAVLHPQENDA